MDFKRLTVGKRISLGFSAILIVLGLIVIIGHSRISEIAFLSGLVQESIEQDKFLVQKEVDHLNWVASLSSSMLNDEKPTVQLDPTKCGFGKWLYSTLGNPKLLASYPEEVTRVLREIEPLHRDLHKSAVQITDSYIQFDLNLLDSLSARWQEHLLWLKNLQNYLISDGEFVGQLNPKKCGFGKWFSAFRSDDPQFMAILRKMEAPHNRFHRSAKEIVRLKKAGRRSAAIRYFKAHTLNDLNELARIFKEAFDYIKSLKEKKSLSNQTYINETMPALDSVKTHLGELRASFNSFLVSRAGNAATDLAGTATFAKRFILVAGLISLIVGIFLAVVITKSITAPIIRIADYLRDSSTQVASASSQLSESSQELSSISSEQASSIEETSSSLEEIGGMIKSSVDLAKDSSSLATEMDQSSQVGNEAMDKLVSSMEEILESNSKIQELVKVIAEIGEKTAIIDEIVFQTKLLSFNASVEAERAGEHGRGFAVVAQEVGNLAQMSGKAATEISSIVKQSIVDAEAITKENEVKVDGGNEIAQSSASILSDINNKAKVVAESVQKILSACENQESGINQINSAIGDLDKATQQNAATAEESASASEELSSQAQNLEGMVRELTLIVLGDNDSEQKAEKLTLVPEAKVERSSISKANITEQVGSVKGAGDDWESL